MGERPPVADWTRDFDHNHPDWSNDPHAIWDDLRAHCPVAHTDRYPGVYLPVRHDDIRTIAYDTEHFSSRRISILEKPPISAPIPPVTSDPPKHRAQRMMLLPAFTPAAIAELEPVTRRMCNELIDGFIGTGRCDAAADYASHVPTRVISRMLGVDERDGDRFRTWIHDLAGDGVEDGAVFMRVIEEIDAFFRAEVAARQANPRPDLIGFLMGQTIEGEPLSEQHLLGTLRLLLLAGIDTTWSSISHTLLHLARTPRASPTASGRAGPHADRDRGVFARACPGIGCPSGSEGPGGRRLQVCCWRNGAATLSSRQSGSREIRAPR